MVLSACIQSSSSEAALRQPSITGMSRKGGKGSKLVKVKIWLKTENP